LPVSLVLLSWNRIANLQKIVDSYSEIEQIDEIIIWNNNMRLMIRGTNKTRVIYSSEDFGMRTRFAAALFAKNNCIILHDDDTLLPSLTIDRLYEEWRKESEIMHGLWGVVPKSDNTYPMYVQSPAKVDMIIGRCMVIDKKYCRDFFTIEQDFPAPINHGAPHGCEDILMSYMVMKISGKKNQSHSMEHVDLPNDHAICDRPMHYEHRTEFMQLCQLWLAGYGENEEE